MKGILQRIANDIGNTTPDTIEYIVNLSNEKKLLYHGIKKGQYAEIIKQEGIRPLTPECGWCSFWSSGLSLFHMAIDSPFFRYSGGYSKELKGQELNLAITSYDLLSKRGIKLPKFKKDSQIKIHETIPYEDLAILNVKLRHEEPGRKYGQMAEQILLELIISQTKSLTPGQTIVSE